MDLEHVEYQVTPQISVRVELSFILGDHQFLGIAAQVRQGVNGDRDTFSNALVDILDRVPRQEVPDPSLFRHVEIFKCIVDSVEVEKDNYKATHGGKELSKTAEEKFVKDYLRVAVGNVKGWPLVALGDSGGVLQRLECRYYIPPGMHNQNKMSEGALQVVNYFVSDPTHRRYWDDILDQIASRSARGEINLNMRNLRALIQEYANIFERLLSQQICSFLC